MKLQKVRIQDFWCIEDSEEFRIDPVTCLVGKNESGKTATLRALHKLKPASPDVEKFVPSRDYPKRKWRPDIPVSDTPPAVSTEWQVSDQEVSALEERFGKGILANNTYRLTISHNNKRLSTLSVNAEKAIDHLKLKANLSEEDKAAIAGIRTLEQLKKKLEETSPRSAGLQTLLETIVREFPNGILRAVSDQIQDALPTFLYFDQYLRLPGIVSVEELLRRSSQGALTDSDNVFMALMALAGTKIETIHTAKTFEELNSSLRAVSNQISDIIFQYWSQNRHLQVDVRFDHARPQDPPPFNSGFVVRTRVNNLRHRADTSFDERSSGFVWFFSFLVWFYHLRETNKGNLVILLDEPGLTLHARAQADLLRYINEQLRPHYQVIYTTHSPFMIDPDQILSARTVEDVVITDPKTHVDALLGTKISKDVLSTDVDTISPLQRALDYEMTQTLFIGRHTILVEGPSDLLYLKWFSKRLELSGLPGLDYRWTIAKVGGVDRIPGFVSLFRANNLHIAAFIDVQSGQNQRIENARKALVEKHLLTADTYANQKEADLEDLLGWEFYAGLVNLTWSLPPRLRVLQTQPAEAVGGRVIVEVERHFSAFPAGAPEFNHFNPSEYLYTMEEDPTKIPGFDRTLSNMKKLIDDLNGLMVGAP
ncbi:MAG: AAA family ATPase [Spirochaetia bacterium]